MWHVPEWLVRCGTYPLHERLRGRDTLHEMRDLGRIIGLAQAGCQGECAARLRALLSFARDHLPYYQQLFRQRGLDPAAGDPFGELAKLPVLRKPEVRANAEQMIWRHVPGGLLPGVSGGTTGDTLHYYIDHKRAAQTMGARLYMQQLFGVRPGERRAYLWGSPLEAKRSRLRRWRDRLINEIVLDAFDLSARQVDDYLAQIVAFRPRLIYAYPNAAALLARRAIARYRPRDFSCLRAVILTGDEVSAEDRLAVAEGFKCPVGSEYGSREVGLIGHECPSGRMHVITPHVHVEIVQDQEHAATGDCGEVVCTNLNTRAQPLIRYHVGDVGAWSRGGCDCGLPLPVLELTGARTTGFIVMRDGGLRHGHLTAYLVRADPCVVEFKVFQRAVDAFEILLVVDRRFSSATIPGIQQRFASYFGPEVRVKCTVVDRIPPDPSGKRRRFISDVAAPANRQLGRPEPEQAGVGNSGPA